MRPEVHVFIIWPRAHHLLDRIVEDLRTHFRILDALRLHWDSDDFERNMLRYYGSPVLLDRKKRASRGSPVVLLVEDEAPAYAEPKDSSGSVRVNTRTFDAKRRYRSWAGGGHGVHASNSLAEVDRDLFFLLGVSPGSPVQAERWDGGFRDVQRDLAGSKGWSDAEELFTGISLSTPCVVLVEGPDCAHVLTDSVEWAILFANADHPRREPAGIATEVRVGARPFTLVFQEPGDGVLDRQWQGLLLELAREAPRPARASPRDQLLVRLQLELAYGDSALAPSPAELANLETATGDPAIDPGDPIARRALLESELGKDGYTFSSAGSHARWNPRLLPGQTPDLPRPRRLAALKDLVRPVRGWLLSLPGLGPR